MRSARIVLFDPLGVRSAMTAAWLRQMGYAGACVLDGGDAAIPMQSDMPTVTPPGLPDPEPPAISSAELHALGERATVIDLGPGKDYVAGHVPGAWWTVRARLAQCLARIPAGDTLVLVSPDALLARLAFAEARALHRGRVLVLAGGSAAWKQAGLPLESGEARLGGPIDDAFVKPFEAKDRDKAMQDYLDWEVDLIDTVRKDPSVVFSLSPAPTAG